MTELPATDGPGAGHVQVWVRERLYAPEVFVWRWVL